MQALSQQLANVGLFSSRQQVRLTLGELDLPFRVGKTDEALRRLPACFFSLTSSGLTAAEFVTRLRGIIEGRKEMSKQGVVAVPFVRDHIYGLCQLAHRQRDTHKGPEWVAYQRVIRQFLQMKKHAPLNRSEDVTLIITALLEMP